MGGLPDVNIEIVHQIKNSEPKFILAHPTMVKTAVGAAAQCGLPKSRIFQFSDVDNPPIEGVQDWRNLIGSPSEGDKYSWPKLTAEESVNTVAAINYSSGTTYVA
jgi:4-coumarate--CoA ligase